MRRISILLLSFLLIANISFARTDIDESSVVQSKKIKKKRYFFTKTLDDLKTVGKVKHITDNKKVVVPYFRVTFSKGGKYLNSVGGVTTSKTKIYSKLNGIEDSTFQEITDSLYNNLLEQLSDAGYEVLDQTTLDENEKFSALQEKSKYPKTSKNQSQHTPNNRYYPGKIAVKAYMIAQDFDALFLKADYTVNFISMARNEKKISILKDKSDVKVGQGINVFGELSVITEKGPVSFLTQQPIGSDITFGSVEDATTGMNKASDGIALVGSLLGGKVGNRQSTSSVEVNADTEGYKKAATDALIKSTSTLVSYMASSIAGEEITENDMDSDNK